MTSKKSRTIEQNLSKLLTTMTNAEKNGIKTKRHLHGRIALFFPPRATLDSLESFEVIFLFERHKNSKNSEKLIHNKLKKNQ